ncbi:hypothetical protein [Arenicella xantha]|uniref:Uncharacterized protein n=1 Tax=Arenicella xantha TaxID=644221 RepID=A0A395JT32_9GAMM|nr:hypothetical protein [Arenicella xantha]RBP52718.1 hypothetical protein DFR28_101100 [Arenicella xantha]
MSDFIQIERVPYEEPHHIELNWKVSNRSICTEFTYYDNATSLIQIANGLDAFPKHANDVFLYEIGSEKPEDNFAYYFGFKLFTINGVGNSAIQIRFCDNPTMSYPEISQLCIQAEPADLHRLGKQFREFSKLEKTFLAWSRKESFIGEKYDYA